MKAEHPMIPYGFILPLLGALSLAPVSVAADAESAWTLIGPGGGGHLTSFVADHADPQVLFTSVNCGGIRKSVDGGKTWRMENRDFDYEHDGIVAQKVAAMAQHPTNARSLLAAMFGGGIYSSADGGESWRPLYRLAGASKAEAFTYFAFDPEAPGTAYTSLGGNVDRILTPVKPGVERHVKISKGAVLRGRLQTDGRWAWEEIGDLRDAVGRPLNSYSSAVNPRDRNELLFVTRAGLYRGRIESSRLVTRSVDHTRAGLPDASRLDGGKIVFDPRRPGVAFLTLISLKGSDGGFFKSVDGGTTWKKMARGLDSVSGTYYDIQLHPADPQTLYLGQFRNKISDGDRKRKLPGGLYRSRDGGESWGKIVDPQKLPWGWRVVDEDAFGAIYLAVSAKRPNALYFTASAGQIFATSDATAETPAWEQITTRSVGDGRWTTTGLEAIALPHSIGVDPRNPDVLYVPYGDHGIFESRDGGKSLKLLPQRARYSGKFIVDGRTPGRLYLATRGPHLQLEDGEVMESDDAGKSWASIGGAGSTRERGGKRHRRSSPGDDGDDGDVGDDSEATDLRADRKERRAERRERRGGGKERRGDRKNHRTGGEDLVTGDMPRGAMTAFEIQDLEGGRKNLFVCNYQSGLYVKEGTNPWRSLLRETGCHSFAEKNGFRELYAGVDGKGLFKLTRSSDGWTDAQMAAASPEVGDTFFDLAIGSQSGTVYVATSQGVFALPPDGKLEKRLELPEAMAIETDARETVLYAASPRRGLFRSTDRGKTWRDVSSGLGSRAIMALTLSPSEPDTIYASARCCGIWKKRFSSAPGQ
jgi:photosystem II stability/assembly factor-like uncharacterized protein